MISKRASLRQIIAPPTWENNGKLTVYLGLFNAEPYLADILEDLKAQHGSFSILVVDNASTDETWSKVQSWASDFEDRLMLVRNEVNLGGGGSLLANLDLIKSHWFATWHQDDRYLPTHVETFLARIPTTSSNSVCMTTEMGRLDGNGAAGIAPLRAAWFLPDHDQTTLFLSNLRLHNVPFPAAAFKTSVFSTFAGPWHSAAFPDTEWVLNAVMCKGEFIFIDVVTMLYRENDLGESRSLKSQEQEIGAFCSIARVINSNHFLNFCKDIDYSERSPFARALQLSLKSRLTSPELHSLLALMANEQMAFAWDYKVPEPLDGIYVAYESIDGTSTMNLALRLLDRKPRANRNLAIRKVSADQGRSSGLMKTTHTLSGHQRAISALLWHFQKLPGFVRVLKKVGPRLPLPAAHPWRGKWK